MKKSKMLKALLWKNYLYLKRRFIMLLFLLLLPIVFFIFLAYFFNKTPPVQQNPNIGYGAISENELYISAENEIMKLHYAPQTSFTKQIMAKVYEKIPIQMIGYPDEEILLKSFNSTETQNGIVIFEISDGPTSSYSYTLEISRNLNTEHVFIIPNVEAHQNNGLIYFGHAGFQMAIDKAIIELTSEKDVKDKITVEMFPYPPTKQPWNFEVTYLQILPFLTAIGYIIILLFITSSVISEKETGIKELMKMMGMKNNILWFSHYINYLILSTVIAVFITLIVAFYPGGKLLPLLDKSIFFITILFYSNYIIMLGFLFSTFSTRRTLICIVLALIWIGSCFLSNIIIKKSMHMYCVILSCFVPNFLIFQFYRNVGIYEASEAGSTYNNIWETPVGNGNELCILVIWAMFLVNIIIFTILTFYLDQVNPGPYGIPKLWNFPFIKATKKNNIMPDNSEMEDVNVDPTVIEKFPNQEAYISIQKLSKVFGSWNTGKTIAISNLSFDIYRDGITALLGHNGAGKTTLMSIISGMITPTTGTILVDWKDIRYDMSEIHSNIGFCPQENLFFPYMTIREHLIFFSVLKGFTKEQGKKESDALLSHLGLTNKANELSDRLSGGMQRRLQIAIALSGSASLLILDEPTSGLDPETRRELWDILLELRNTRTILLTTHSMEEADALGEKVVIMDHGKLVCYGTPMFLKTKYKTGYKLHLYKEDNFNSFKVNLLIKNVVLDVERVEDQEKVVFNLPFEQSSGFTELFKRLEAEKDSLGIRDIRLLTTSLEDVFLKVTQSKVKEDENIVRDQFDFLDSVEMKDKKVTSYHIFCSQWIGLWERKFYFLKNSNLFTACSLILVAWLISALLFLPASKRNSDAKIKTDLSLYDKNKLTIYMDEKINTEKINLYLEKYNAEIKLSSNVTQDLLARVIEKPGIYGKNLIIAIDYDGNSTYNAMYSTSVHHALPTAVNFVTNLIANDLKTPRMDSYITTQVKNLPDKLYFYDEDVDIISGTLCISLSLSFLLVISISFPISEKNSQSRKLSLMTGIHPAFYWICHFIFDLIFMMLTSVILYFLAMGYYMQQGVSIPYSSEMWGMHFFTIFMYWISGLAFVYFLSFIVNHGAVGFIIIFILNLIFGIITPYFILIFSNFVQISTIFKWIVGIIFPPFNFSLIYFRMGETVSYNAVCLKKNNNTSWDEICCRQNPCVGLKHYFDDEVWTLFAATLCSLVVYWILIFIIEFVWIQRMISSFIYSRNQDLLKENRKKPNLQQTQKIPVISGNALIGTDLSKIYQSNPFRKPLASAKHVNIEVKKGECIGLLGINGAGKTTLFKMMTGYEIPSTGDSRINTCSLSNRRRRYLSQLGYCPQFDGLDYYLTGRQILVFFCRLRGVHFDNIDGEVRSMLNLTGLAKAADKKCGNYSGGMRRRLNAAVSLIANREFVLLDEPTTGVDPGARSMFHSVMQKMKAQGRSILLSSHNLKECEKLCDSLCIMSRGRILHKGTIPDLKSIYASGYILTIKLKTGHISASSAATAASHDVVDGNSMSQLVLTSSTFNISKKMIVKLKDKINKEFTCCLRDEHSNILQYQLKTALPFGEVFDKMDSIRNSFSDMIEIYTIADTSLEELFLIMQKQDDAKLLEDQDDIV